MNSIDYYEEGAEIILIMQLNDSKGYICERPLFIIESPTCLPLSGDIIGQNLKKVKLVNN